MYSWTTRAFVESVGRSAPAEDAVCEIKKQHEHKRTGVHNFLERVLHELRNLGVTPLERAMNFSATNAFQIEKLYESVPKEKERMELDSISVTRSPICLPIRIAETSSSLSSFRSGLCRRCRRSSASLWM
jgi:hypothetical protein